MIIVNKHTFTHTSNGNDNEETQLQSDHALIFAVVSQGVVDICSTSVCAYLCLVVLWILDFWFSLEFLLNNLDIVIWTIEGQRKYESRDRP